MSERSSRQSFLGPNSEAVLRNLHIGIVGLGGGGSHVAQQLAHVGIGKYTLIDHDRIDESNLNRLIGGTAADVRNGTLKTTIAARQIRRVLPQATKITKVKTRLQVRPECLTVCDAVFGCLDSFDARLQLEALCRRYLIPYIDLGMDVSQFEGGFLIFGQVALSMPDHPCLQCTNVIKDEWRAKEAAGYGAAGGRPQVVWPNGVLASLAVGILIQLVTPWYNDCRNSTLLEYDGNNQTVVRSTMLNSLTGCPHFESLDNVGDPWFNLTK